MHERANIGITGRMAVRPAAGSRTVLTGMAGAIVVAGLTVVGANIVIPLFPVPITLQTLFVLLAGAAIGGRYGSLGQGMYLAIGALGAPVFAGRIGGLAALGGPTGGYLLSFFVVPFIVAALLRHSRSVPWLIFSYSAGTAVIFAFGVAHLALFYTNGASEAIRVGLLPFLPGAVIKIAAAVSISRSYWALTSRRGRAATD